MLHMLLDELWECCWHRSLECWVIHILPVLLPLLQAMLSLAASRALDLRLWLVITAFPASFPVLLLGRRALAALLLPTPPYTWRDQRMVLVPCSCWAQQLYFVCSCSCCCSTAAPAWRMLR
jgi:hypothetical protein